MSIVSICIPVRHTVPVEFFLNLFPLISATGKLAKPSLHTSSVTPLDCARNMLVEEALQANADYVLFVDSDTIIPTNAFELLSKHNKDIVSGLYFAVTPPYEPIVKKVYDKDVMEDIRDKDVQFEHLQKVDGVGLGCCLIKTSVFKDVPRPWFVHSVGISEDLYFCKKATERGYEVYLDPTVLCSHWGGAITIENFLANRSFARLKEAQGGK